MHSELQTGNFELATGLCIPDLTTMEDSVSFLFSTGRRLLEKDGVSEEFKESLWSRESIDPAMLRVPVVILIFIALWSVNLLLLDRCNVSYHGVLQIKNSPIVFAFWVSLLGGIIYLVNYICCFEMVGFNTEFTMSMYYFVILLSIFIVNNSCFDLVCGVCIPQGIVDSMNINENKNSFMRLLRMIFIPNNMISFPEIVLADAMTSMSKVFKDVGITIIAIYSSVTNTPIITYHNEGMILIALLAALPFAIRVRQCSIQYLGCNDSLGRIPIMLNIIKYCTAFPPIFIACMATLGYYHPYLPFLTSVLTAVNSLYSFTWDIMMDWGLLQISLKEGKLVTRSQSYFPTLLYYCVSVSNLILRFAWASNIYIPYFQQMEPHHLVFMLEVVEVIRRAVWNIFRIEWEIINNDREKDTLEEKERDKQARIRTRTGSSGQGTLNGENMHGSGGVMSP